MRLRPSLACLFALTLTVPALAQNQLATVLAQLDTASASFKNVRVDLHQEFYEKAIHAVSTVQNGALYVERKGGQTSMGAVLSEQGSSAKPQVIQFTGGVLRLFKPVPQDQIDEFKAKAGQADSFLTLGFGGSGKELAANWNIKDLGPETIDSVKTEKLELTPKDPKVAANFDKITLWIDPTRGVSLKQVFHTPEGDYRTAVYSNIKLNGRIDTGTFAIKTDKNTKTVVH